MHATAQEAVTGKPKPAYHAIGSIGLLDGEKSTSLQLQLVNGISYKNWYAGIGTGLDYYAVRSIPLTGYIERTFSNRLPIFAYGSAGIHFVWPRDYDAEFRADYSEYNRGLYYDAGIGYRFALAKKGSIRMSVGFSEKQYRETWEQPYIWGPPGQNPYKEVYDYRLKRLSIRAGFQF